MTGELFPADRVPAKPAAVINQDQIRAAYELEFRDEPAADRLQPWFNDLNMKYFYRSEQTKRTGSAIAHLTEGVDE